MVRSMWKKALVITFAWAGLAWAQQPLTSSAPATRPELRAGQTFTVQEPGKVGQKCQVLKTWKTPEGKTAYQVQALATGEMMTIVETGPGPNLPLSQAGNGAHAQAVATRIFHWGSDRTPPAGTPMPPGESVPTMPLATPRSEAAKAVSLAPPQPAQTAGLAPAASTHPTPAHPEFAKPSFFSRLFSRSSGSPGSTTIYSAPETISGSSPISQQASTAPTKTPTALAGPSAPVPEQRVQTSAPTLLPQSHSFGSAWSNPPKSATSASGLNSASTVQQKTGWQDTWMTPSKTAPQDKANASQAKSTAPADGFGAQPITPAKPSFQNPWLIQPKTTPSDKSSSPADQARSTSTSGRTVSTPSSPYFQTSPGTASRAIPPSATAPQRVVQVVPPGSAAPSQTPTTTSAAPAASGWSNNLLNRQVVPVAPGSKTTYPPVGEKKPADARMNASAPVPRPSTGQAATMSTATPAKTTSSMSSTLWPTPGMQTATTITPTPAKTTATLPSTTWPTPGVQTATTITPTPAKTTATLPSTTWPTSAAPSPASTIYKPTVSTLIPYYPGGSINASTSSSKGLGTGMHSTATTAPSSDRTGNRTMLTNRFDVAKPAAAATAPVATASSTAAPLAKPAPATAAPPTDWRQSWGKMDDARLPTTAKPAQTPTASSLPPVRSTLPQADSKRPDPLQTPQLFDRRPDEPKPSAQQHETRLNPTAAVAPTTAVKPAGASAAESVKIHPPTTAMSVPLGAQSVIQAGDPGPGGVRYVPVPMVTIPDIRRAPVPPMTNPAEVAGTPGAVPAAAHANQMNAFTPAPSHMASAQATNAFASAGQTVVSAPYGHSMTALGTMAQAMPPSGPNQALTSGVVAAGFQGAALPNQIVPASYHATTHEALAPFAPLSTVKPTPENIHQMEVTLRDSLYPSQREWAAESMAAVDWRTHPQVVQALTTAAKEDPAATVRASCVRCLARMQVNTLPVITVVRGLKNDSDPRVRQEAERAWSVLAAGEK